LRIIGGYEFYPSTDAKKTERFRDGLHRDFYERLSLYEPNNYQDLVNKVIFQEDAMTKAQKDRKRQVGFTTAGGSGKRFRFVKKATQGPPHSSSAGHYRMTPSQNKPFENFQYCKAQQQLYKLSLVHPQPTIMLRKIVTTIIVGSRATISVSALNPSKTSKVKAQGPGRVIMPRSSWCKSSRAN
jgi:hypothetical protein